MKRWELVLGRPRAPRLTLGMVAFAALVFAATFGLARLGVPFPEWWWTTVSVVGFIAFVAIPISASAYASIATIVLIAPILWLWFTKIDADLGIGFWCFTAVTTVIGGVLTARSARVWKFYRGERAA